MPVKWGLPSPRLSTKLYVILALFLAIVGLLTAATIDLARDAAKTVTEFRREGYGTVSLTERLQILLEHHRQIVAAAAQSRSVAKAYDERAYAHLNATISDLLNHLAPGRIEPLADRFANLAGHGASALALARTQQREQAAAAAARYAAAAEEFLRDVVDEGKRRTANVERRLETLALRAESVASWVGKAAAFAAFFVAPLGLLLLHRMLARTHAIGTALLRLARNDTSVEIAGTSDQDELGQLARSVAVFKARSIELLAKKADFERLNLQLDAAINNMPLGLSMFDAQERLIVCNQRYAEMYGVPPELARPGTPNCALWEHRTKHGASHSQDRPMNMNATEIASTMLIQLADGRTIEVWRQPIKGGGWVTLHEDITERRQQEDKIQHLARHDALTGLANRMLFREQLEANLQHLERGQGFALLCLDLDHFKAVNDTLGHPVGDELLHHVGQRLASCVRQEDVVARLGGDEFAIVQAGVQHPRQTEALAGRIVEAVSAPYSIDGNRIDIGASIGITLAPRDGADADTLMKNADLALYRTKGAGRRGFAFFEQTMCHEVQKRSSLELELRRALQEEQLELQYQPVVNLTSDRPVAFEALLRWQHPERGWIHSSELLQMAEQTGLLGELSTWTLHHACAQAARWSAPLKVAVSFGQTNPAKQHLTENVLQALACAGLPAHRLELEIAKSVLHQHAGTLPVLHQLRQLGVSIAVDAAGEDHCSLSCLRAFPFDKIKIGPAFTAEIGQSKEARAIIEAIASLAANLGMATLAQGIDDFEQLELLRERGCSEGQGLLLGPPLAWHDVEAFIAMRTAAAEAAARLKALAEPETPPRDADPESEHSSRAA